MTAYLWTAAVLVGTAASLLLTGPALWADLALVAVAAVHAVRALP